MKKPKQIFILIIFATPLLLALCMLLGPSGCGLPDIRTTTGKMILYLRANRVITGFFVGAALSCSGTVFQALLRNPLAEPYVLGVSSGAGLGAAIAIFTGISLASVFTLPLCAFAGGSITLAIVFLIASQNRATSAYGLILSGVIISSICSSILMFLITIAPSEGLHNVIWWMLGNLQPTSIKLLIASAITVTIGCCVLWLFANEFNALTLGKEIAHHVGIKPNMVMIIGLGFSTLITACAVGISGLIGFVGLIVPHATRSLLGPNHRLLIPAATIAGGIFLAICDAVARTIISPIEIPVGVVTAILGGPFFLIILRKSKKNWLG